MKIRRTANAGVLLQLDGKSILLDGVCRELKPYPATPATERKALSTCWPDLVAFTHAHEDHYDPDFAAEFQRQTGGVILGSVPGGTNAPQRAGDVTVTAVQSRHIGAAYQNMPHVSFIIEGSRCLWFTGDASPLQWKGKDAPRPDVVIAPYAYAATSAALKQVEAFGAKVLVLVHLPDRGEDPFGLWNAVDQALQTETKLQVLIPDMGETLTIET